MAFEKLTFPLGWGVTYFLQQVKVIKTDEDTGFPIYTININEHFVAEYEVEGRRVLDQNIINELPVKINSVQQLRNALNFFSIWKRCEGSPESKFVLLYDNRNYMSGFKDTLTGAIHSARCCLVLKNASRKRCFHCVKQRSSFQVAISKKKSKPSAAKRFHNLSKTDLVTELKESKVMQVKLNAKLKRLKVKIEKNIRKNSEHLEQENHNALMTILKKNLGEPNPQASDFHTLFLKTQLQMLQCKKHG